MEPSTFQVFTLLLNAGGFATLAGVLFYLHTTALKSFNSQHDKMLERFDSQHDGMLTIFREELQAERDQCREDHEKIMLTLVNHHEAIMSLWRK